MADNKKINDEILEEVSGGKSEEQKAREEAEKKLHGRIVKDMFGNVTFTDKTGVTGSFTAADWAKLSANWAYTGNPEYFMETINVNELNGVLKA
ncbi:MAG: hypothetical protein K6F28_09100 [Lachnospiraceae bacterium]|nr:hypothetical protein [Lachnospiraceae bacterium]